jgi:hypothetical protein
MAEIKKKGTRAIKKEKNPLDPIFKIKPVRIFNKVCPDIKFAKSRIAKLKAREIYETNSIHVNNGKITKGRLGKKNLNHIKPFFEMAKIVMLKITPHPKANV